MSNGDQFRELIEAYALGALDVQERAVLETHLANGCADCTQALEEARWLVTQLAYAAPTAEPSDMLKGRLMHTVRAEAEGPKQSAYTPSRVPVWLWAGVAALLALTLYSNWEAHRMGEVIRDSNARMEAALKQNQQLQQQLAMEKRAARIMMDPNSKKIMLPASDKEMPQLEAMWNPQLGLCLMGHKVPMPTEKRVFQLWMIPKGEGTKPMPSETLWPDADGKVMLVVQNPPEQMWNTKALAITEEPAGGSEQPTGTPMWVGGVS